MPSDIIVPLAILAVFVLIAVIGLCSKNQFAKPKIPCGPPVTDCTFVELTTMRRISAAASVTIAR